MNNILTKICEDKKLEIEILKKKCSLKSLKKLVSDKIIKRDFKSNILNSSVEKKNFIIGEIKKASPSAGEIINNYEPVEIAKIYERAGAKAISILTEKNYFKGEIDHLSFIKQNTNIPILRKDFIIDEYQIYESKFYRADAILFIASILSQKQLNDFVLLAKKIDLECLVEVHNLNELEKALTTPARIIGINNRNLNDFSVDINTTLNLIKNIPDHVLKVSESGIFNKNDISVLGNVGCNAVLIGEAIITSDDPYKKIIELTND